MCLTEKPLSFFTLQAKYKTFSYIIMTKIDERKNIIVSLKSNYGARKKGIEKRIKYLKGVHILNLICTILCGGIIILTIILEPLGFEFLKWQKNEFIDNFEFKFYSKITG